MKQGYLHSVAPSPALTRRSLLVGAGALGLLSACGTPNAAPVGPAVPTAGFPATVVHRNGTTVIPKEPQRVVTVGFSDQDPVLALGVRPVAVTDWYGDHAFATWPWAQAALGDTKPVVFNRGQFTGTQAYKFEEIAAQRPDLILGLYTGMTDTEFQTLSKIAPTVGPPKDFPEFGAPWQEYTRLAGRALGRSDKAEQLIAGVDAKLAAAKAAHPAFVGKTTIVAERQEPGQTFARSPNDQRSQLMTGLGFVIPPKIGELSGDKDGATISDEQMGLLDVDLLLWNIGYSPEVRPEIEAAPLYKGLKVVQAGRSLFIDDPMVSAAWVWGTVLSLPTVIDGLVAKLETVVK